MLNRFAFLFFGVLSACFGEPKKEVQQRSQKDSTTSESQNDSFAINSGVATRSRGGGSSSAMANEAKGCNGTCYNGSFVLGKPTGGCTTCESLKNTVKCDPNQNLNGGFECPPEAQVSQPASESKSCDVTCDNGSLVLGKSHGGCTTCESLKNTLKCDPETNYSGGVQCPTEMPKSQSASMPSNSSPASLPASAPSSSSRTRNPGAR